MLAVKLDSEALTAVAALPLAVPGVVAIVEPYAVVRPYSTLIVVAALLAITLAPIVAEFVVMALEVTFEILGAAVAMAVVNVALAL